MPQLRPSSQPFSSDSHTKQTIVRNSSWRKQESPHWNHTPFQNWNYKQPFTHADYKKQSSKTRPCQSQRSDTGLTAVVLHWVYNHNNRQKTYIANRLHKKQHTTAISDWKYVPTKHNPADEGTRGIKTTELKHSQWMKRPDFHKLPSHLWPRTIKETTPNTLENMPTSKTDDIQTYSLICNTPQTFVDYKRFSSWKRLLQTTFYTLKTYINQKGTLRSLSRLQKPPINFRIKHPQIVDVKHYNIQIYIQHIHEDEGHVGLEHMRIILQQEHWMNHLTTTLNQIIYNRFIYKRQWQLPTQPKLGNLPEFRFAKTPFEDIGMDYFGPFPVCQRNQCTSQYVCIFTCFKTRAVHFEVVEDLTTDNMFTSDQTIHKPTRKTNKYNIWQRECVPRIS